MVAGTSSVPPGSAVVDPVWLGVEPVHCLVVVPRGTGASRGVWVLLSTSPWGGLRAALRRRAELLRLRQWDLYAMATRLIAAGFAISASRPANGARA